MFSGASNFAVSGGIFTINQTNNTQTTVHISTGLDKLSAAAAHSALHDAPARTNGSGCLQNTRTNVLNHLTRWAQGVCDERIPIFWMQGGAGAGKSAIMQTLAEQCVAQGLALGSFFFSRSDTTRNTAEALIPTLVYQLVQLFPSGLPVLDPIIDRDPLVFKKSLHVQFLGLFVPVLQHVHQLGTISNAPNSPRVFLIDELDECNDPVQQQDIIQVVAALCHEHRIPVKFLIASRQEHQISTSFRWHKEGNHLLGVISLSEDADAEADIRRFIEDQFTKVRILHPFNQMIPSGWPTLYDIDRLVWKSSSHFIYASTVTKYIFSMQENPGRSLEVVLGLQAARTVSPFAELDALYHHILSSAAHLDKVLQILAHCIFTSLPSLVTVVAISLECSFDDIHVFLADMAPLVTFSRPNPTSQSVDEEAVRILHASLGDFLRDPLRSQSLYLDEKAYHSSKLRRSFDLQDLYSRQQQTNPAWPNSSAASRFSDLHYHICQTIDMSIDIPTTLDTLRSYNFKSLLECHQRIHNKPDSVGHLLVCYMIAIDSGLVKSQNDRGDAVRSMFRNSLRDFFDIFESRICLDAPKLGSAILSLIFSKYPEHSVLSIMSRHCPGTACGMMTRSSIDRACSYFGQTKSNSNNASGNDFPPPEHASASATGLAEAAQAILEHLLGNQEKSHCLLHGADAVSVETPHVAWLRRKKPGNHVAMGAPKLASTFHTRCVRNMRKTPPFFRLRHQKYLEGLWFSLPSMRSVDVSSADAYFDLLKALIWVLPKAGYSNKVILYSGKMFPRRIYQLNPMLVHRVRRRLDRYRVRVQAEKLQELSRKIEDCDLNALIEKSSMFHLDAQD